MKACGWLPGEHELAKKPSAAAINTLRANVDTLLAETTKLDNHVASITGELSEMGECAYTADSVRRRKLNVLSDFQEQLSDLRDLIHERTGNVDIDAIAARIDLKAVARLVPSREDDTLSELVHASNKHTANFSHSVSAIGDITSRLRAVESAEPASAQSARITQLEATVDAQATAIQALLARLPPDLAAPLPAAQQNPEFVDPVALKAAFAEFLNANGKRARD